MYLYECDRSSKGVGRGVNRSVGGEYEESRESGNSNRDRENNREVEGRYGELYEQRMNPFAEVPYSQFTMLMSLHCIRAVMMITMIIIVWRE